MIDLNQYHVLDTPTIEQGIRFLKTEYQGNFDRFKERFLKPCYRWLSMNEVRAKDSIIEMYEAEFLATRAYTYAEAFVIDNATFRAKVFSVINVGEMVQNLGSERISTKGIELVNKTYEPITDTFTDVNLHQIYELHKCSGEKLGLEEDIYCIKCWCTSTNNEHWLWVDKYYEDPLEAIASMCRIYKPMLGKIKHIIRQGDVFLFEMTEEVPIDPNDEIVSLTKDTYFSLLKSQS